MTKPTKGNTPDDPAPGGSDPGLPHPPTGGESAPEAKPPADEEKKDERSEGDRTTVLPMHETPLADFEAPRTAVPATVVTKPGEAPPPPANLDNIIGDDDAGKKDESGASGGGGDVPPTGPEPSPGGDDKEDPAIGQITAMIRTLVTKVGDAKPEQIAKAERALAQVKALLTQCRRKDVAIHWLEMAIKTGSAASLDHLIGALMELGRLIEDQVSELSLLHNDPVHDEVDEYLAKQQPADEDVG